jgi:5'-methylthioadenosine phosphorylase
MVEIGLVGGTGFYRLFGDSHDVEVTTPYGDPSAPVSVGVISGREVAFLPRHGRSHEYLPAEVPYRANLDALRQLGARQVIGFNTVGSLQTYVRRGDFVFTDQFVDRTAGRIDTIFTGADGAHVSTADPYCERMRQQAIDAAAALPYRFHPKGIVVVIQGPRFSTRAESRWFTSLGWHTINMTQYPEVVLAREMELCFMNLSFVTDYDVAAKEVVGAEDEEPVSHLGVIREFSHNEPRIVDVVTTLVSAIKDDESCACRSALANARVRR